MIRVVQGADEVLIALVEVLGIDAVADVDETLRRELADVTGAHLVDAESDGAVVGVGDGTDEHDVGQRLDRTADRDVDERLAAGRRRRILLGDGDRRRRRRRRGSHQQHRESPDHGRQRRPGRCGAAGTRRYWRRGLQPVPALSRPSARLRAGACACWCRRGRVGIAGWADDRWVIQTEPKNSASEGVLVDVDDVAGDGDDVEADVERRPIAMVLSHAAARRRRRCCWRADGEGGNAEGIALPGLHLGDDQQAAPAQVRNRSHRSAAPIAVHDPVARGDTTAAASSSPCCPKTMCAATISTSLRSKCVGVPVALEAARPERATTQKLRFSRILAALPVRPRR